jgi:hypothetical protein
MALGPALGPIRLNYCRFFLLFSLADAVVDLIEEGGSRRNELGPDRPNRRFELMFRFYGPTKALFDKAWTLPDVETVSAK